MIVSLLSIDKMVETVVTTYKLIYMGLS